jgi:putative SOS response-associated peptidase YedK
MRAWADSVLRSRRAAEVQHNQCQDRNRPDASYRGPWKRAQPCFVVMRGFYEWQVQADGKTMPGDRGKDAKLAEGRILH